MEKYLLTSGTCVEIEYELIQILTDLGMEPIGRRDHLFLKEAILMAIQSPNSWETDYLDCIGRRENITRERVRQMLHKAAWNHWRVNSKELLSKHFGHPVQTHFEYVKPNHVEFITLISKEMRTKYKDRIDGRNEVAQ